MDFFVYVAIGAILGTSFFVIYKHIKDLDWDAYNDSNELCGLLAVSIFGGMLWPLSIVVFVTYGIVNFILKFFKRKSK